MAFIEASTGRRADLVVGKPHTGIVQAALRRTGLQVGQMAMVGDRLYTDVETGLKSGMLSILVMLSLIHISDPARLHERLFVKNAQQLHRRSPFASLGRAQRGVPAMV